MLQQWSVKTYAHIGLDDSKQYKQQPCETYDPTSQSRRFFAVTIYIDLCSEQHHHISFSHLLSYITVYNVAESMGTP